jgi:hypothetical protein
MQGIFYEPNMDLTFKITGAMPLMDVDFLSFPTTMYQGQLEQVNVQFKVGQYFDYLLHCLEFRKLKT